MENANGMSECPECGNVTLKRGESKCEYCRSAIGVPGSAMILLAIVGLAIFAGFVASFGS